jgi:drug/metabolite transporter (DMT)-like permease
MSGKPKTLIADYALLITLAAMFGASFMMTKVAVVDVPPATIALSRILIGGVMLYFVMLFYKQNLRSLLPHWKMITLAGFFGTALPFFLISWGQEKVDAGLTSILMAVMPLITLVLAHFFTNDEKLNLFKIMGFCLGLVGVAVLIGFDKLASFTEEAIRSYAIMLAACSYAVHAILSKYLTGVPRYAVSSAVLLASVIILLPIVLYLDAPWSLSISTTSWWMLVLLGIFPTGVGMLMLFAIIERQGAGFLSQINFLVPVFGILWAIALIDETLPPNALAALVIILAGVAIARIKYNKEPIQKPIENTIENSVEQKS